MSPLKSHLALFTANLIYAVNYSIAKDVMPFYLSPFAFIFIRALFGSLLFWITAAFFIKHEKIEKRDFLRLAFCGLFGVTINQLSFFYGLNLTHPINAAIITTITPILVLIIAGIVLHEKITGRKITGVISGIIGALLILMFKDDFHFGSDTIKGDFFCIVNALSYGIYLVNVKPLMQRYEPLTVIKWVFLFGFIFLFGFGLNDIASAKWETFSTQIWLSIAFVVVFTTFFTYLLNIYALKHVSPSLVSIYIYLQPFLASLIAIMFGKDEITLLKIASSAFIFTGVYLVSFSSKTEQIK